MPAKRYRVLINSLKQLVSTSTSKARRINRARILLLSDESPRGPSKKDREIINILGISGYTGGSDTPEICGRRHSGSTE